MAAEKKKSPPSFKNFKKLAKAIDRGDLQGVKFFASVEMGQITFLGKFPKKVMKSFELTGSEFVKLTEEPVPIEEALSVLFKIAGLDGLKFT